MVAPAGWPAGLPLGMRDVEGGAAALRASAPWELRYHYLSGGAGTARSWRHWANGGGSFVAGFLDDSERFGFLPVFSLYQLQETPPTSALEAEADRVMEGLADPAVLRPYLEDLRLLFAVAGARPDRSSERLPRAPRALPRFGDLSANATPSAEPSPQLDKNPIEQRLGSSSQPLRRGASAGSVKR